MFLLRILFRTASNRKYEFDSAFAQFLIGVYRVTEIRHVDKVYNILRKTEIAI